MDVEQDTLPLLHRPFSEKAQMEMNKMKRDPSPRQ
jgi:hypothetical protein